MKPLSLKKITLGLLIFYVFIAASYLLQFPDFVKPLFTNTIYLIPPLLAVISAAYALKIYHFSTVHGKVIGYIGGGLVCWLIGEAIFYAYQFIFHTNPYPSIADVFYLAAYPLLFAGLVAQIKFNNVSWRDFNRFMLLIIAVLAAALTFFVVYFGVYLAYDSSNTFLGNFIAIGYGIGDLILVIPAIFILKVTLDFKGGKLFKAWLAIFLSLLCFLIADVLFAIFNDQYSNLVPAATLIDLIYVAGYLLFTYSFYDMAYSIKTLQAELKTKRGR